MCRWKDDSDQVMPISIAADSGNVAAMKLLLEKGLDANKAVGKGVRFLQTASVSTTTHRDTRFECISIRMITTQRETLVTY